MEWNLHTLKLQTIQRNRRRYRPENKQLSIVCLFNALFNRLTRRDGITHRIAQVASLCTVYLAWSGVCGCSTSPDYRSFPPVPLSKHLWNGGHSEVCVSHWIAWPTGGFNPLNCWPRVMISHSLHTHTVLLVNSPWQWRSVPTFR